MKNSSSFLALWIILANLSTVSVAFVLLPTPLGQVQPSPHVIITTSSTHGRYVPSTSKIFQQSQDTKEEEATQDNVLNSLSSRISAEMQPVAESISLLYRYLSTRDAQVTPNDIVQLCDELDLLMLQSNESSPSDLWIESLSLKQKALEFSRYHLLVKLMRKDYEAYVETAKFLSPSRIDRLDLPNVQDVPYNDILPSMAAGNKNDNDDNLVEDCTLENVQYQESLLDQILLNIFRDLVEKNTGGISSPKGGIEGLLEQGRTFMLQPNQTPQAQHKMVKETLGGLMTPVLPPFYRLFMSGIVPNLGTPWDGKQLGPWFYAPWLTTIVTPTFFGFLVGPSRPNRRKDGQRGGLVVEKCKFLQESGCKGLCLHQCKIPAQEFFKEELGLDLTVSPNFATQECQWSFGEKPLSPEDDPTFPSGCLKGCESRLAMVSNNSNNALVSCSR